MKHLMSLAIVFVASSSAFGQQYYYVQPSCNQCSNYTQPVTYSQPIYSQPVSYSQPATYTQPVTYTQPTAYSQPTYSNSVPVVTASATTTTPVTTASYSAPTYQSVPVSYSHPVSYSQPVTHPQATYVRPAAYNMGYNTAPSYPYGGGSTGSGVAQQKANLAASRGMRGRHVGGGFGGGNYEGVGFSTSSPQQAIQSACYWGQRPVHQIGVARGADGWYATVLYR